MQLIKAHTIKICSNEKIFNVKFQSIIDRVINASLAIYEHAKIAGDIPNNDWENIRKHLIIAGIKCNSLLALVDLCKPIFHLRDKKVKYWMKMTLHTRKLLRTWYLLQEKYSKQ